MSDRQILTVRPVQGEYARTFGGALPVARIDSDTHLISTGSARPLADVFRISRFGLVQWPVRDYGFAELNTYRFATQAVESPLANVCDTNYTCVGAAFPPSETP
jgi:hypothetical protein